MSQATFLNPMDVKLCKDAPVLYVADYSNHTIRRIDLSRWNKRVLAPTATPKASDAVTAAAGGVPTNGAIVTTLLRPDGNVMSVVAPAALCLDTKGCLYVACKEDHSLKKCSPATVSPAVLQQYQQQLASPRVMALSVSAHRF